MASASAPFKRTSSVARFHLLFLFLRNALLVLVFTFPLVSQPILLSNSTDYLTLKNRENNFIKDNHYYKEKVQPRLTSEIRRIAIAVGSADSAGLPDFAVLAAAVQTETELVPALHV